MSEQAPATLDRDGIAARIPHSASMCLLQRLESWDAHNLHASTHSHVDPQNPLRTATGLLAPCAIEYAAQAMALHGGLLAPAGQAPSAGFLASTRNVQLHRARLDDAPAPLHLHVQRLSGDAQQVMYAFRVLDGLQAPVAEGRAVVVLNTELPGNSSSGATFGAASGAASASRAAASSPTPFSVS